MNLIIHTGEVRNTVPCGLGIIRSSSLTKEEQHCHRSNTFQWLEMEILSIDIVQIRFGGSFFNWFVTLRSVLYRWAPAFSLLDSWCPSLGIMAHLPHRAAIHIPLPHWRELQNTVREAKSYHPLRGSLFKEQMIDCAVLWKHLIKYLTLWGAFMFIQLCVRCSLGAFICQRWASTWYLTAGFFLKCHTIHMRFKVLSPGKSG